MTLVCLILTQINFLLTFLSSLYVVFRPGNTTVSVYGGRDACYSNGWNALEVVADEERQRDITVEYLLTQLEPFTRYATYVKTYTIRTPTAEDRTGQSPIVYFQTKPTSKYKDNIYHIIISSLIQHFLNIFFL